MPATDELQRAVNAARAGQRQEARDLLLKIVEAQPQNETAWVWLSGLVDSLDDQIIACENALTINPQNERVRAYLLQLQEKQGAATSGPQISGAQEYVRQAKNCLESGDEQSALRLAEQAVQNDPNLEEAWLLIADLSPQVGQRIAALERAQQITPLNTSAATALQQARQLRDHPLSVAAQYEQMGQLDKALDLYNQIASKTRDSRQFDKIYSNILRIEALQKEKIQYVSPQTSILRLAVSWPLLYFFLILIHAGLNPFKHFDLHLWAGMPVVALGSFLLSLSEVRSKHALWQKVFSEEGDGSSFARLVTAAAGWMFVIFPHLLLLIDALNRLITLRIPPEPF